MGFQIFGFEIFQLSLIWPC